jgi:hypothetical protein
MSWNGYPNDIKDLMIQDIKDLMIWNGYPNGTLETFIFYVIPRHKRFDDLEWLS